MTAKARRGRDETRDAKRRAARPGHQDRYAETPPDLDDLRARLAKHFNGKENGDE